ncbi:MAG: coenzyme F420-0:L-glutamate ligase [Anaerolineae bacterium]|nr:coenzyme F420-0:L-glutamate ligase [Anaerolineae bacterium]
MNPPHVSLIGVPGLPMVQPGDDLPALIAQALARADLSLQPGDVLVVTSKVVSKAEGRLLDLHTVTPSTRALEVAATTQKDPRLVEVVLRESTAISRMRSGVLIVTHRLGFTSANAGVDHSNVGMGEDWVLLLPEDPDASARALRARLEALTGVAPGVVISDSHGRPFRLGNVNVAIGVAGVPALWDQRGRADLFGRVLRATVTAPADEIAAAAGLVAGQAAEALPVVLVRGLSLPAGDGAAADLVRPQEMDLYR